MVVVVIAFSRMLKTNKDTQRLFRNTALNKPTESLHNTHRQFCKSMDGKEKTRYFYSVLLPDEKIYIQFLGKS